MRTEEPQNLKTLLASLAATEFCYLTTRGRVTGKPHEIEIWFGLHDTTVYLLSGGMDRSDWVRNFMKDPQVTIRIAGQTFHATARLVSDPQEATLARNMLADKYHEREKDDSLSEWARTALVAGFDILAAEK